MVDGYTYVVDMDLSKFFDGVNHDRLMSRLATRVKDKRVLKLIRKYLRSGVMIEGTAIHAEEGTPQ
jgi:retron-type reverse transcriptase